MFNNNGSWRLFRLAGIQVSLHWSWFIAALVSVNTRKDSYSSLIWNLAEYVTLFLIVLLHEFGHALACRQVGGEASRIVLWPLGGVAFVNPPQRPGATLWSIAAGPLVNVILVPVFLLAAVVCQNLGLASGNRDLATWLTAINYINFGLIVFNMMPVYPLDGGQILRCLLWFWLGRTRSLVIASGIGFVGAALLLCWGFSIGSVWMIIIAIFMGMTCRRTWSTARVLSRIGDLPKHEGFACPSCRVAPPIGALWTCHHCRTTFDTFESGAVCPNCQTQFETTACVHCGVSSPIQNWSSSSAHGASQNPNA